MRNRTSTRRLSVSAVFLLASGCASQQPAQPVPLAAAIPAYDILVRGGTIYDGSGGAPFVGDVGFLGDRIVYAGPSQGATATRVVEAAALAVAPGFINMLSWSNESLLVDPRGQSELRQGITLEVMGEGWSMGPLNDRMKALAVKQQGDIKYPIEWNTLGDYLYVLERKGTAMNVASFVGATTVRQHELGDDDVTPTSAQLGRMRALVRQAMREGALGVASSIIYPPATFAKTDELVALSTEAANCGGMYISHMRSEGDRLLESIDELIEISRRSGAPAEIYHLKQAGRANWGKLDSAIAKIEAARASGLRITADMYTYTAGGTGVAASMPPWVQDGGNVAMLKRLRDPATVERIKQEMIRPGSNWENLYYHAGPSGILLTSLTEPSLKSLIGKTVAQVAKERGTSPEQVIIDVVLADRGRAGALYFLMDENNVRRQTGLPWMSFGSDAGAAAPEGVFLKSSTHPRAYGNFARFLSKYVRDEKTSTLADAVRRLTALPASNLVVKITRLVPAANGSKRPNCRHSRPIEPAPLANGRVRTHLQTLATSLGYSSTKS
jgi:N-acyl-D-amino-acid deacylase